ncbi:hypothetical protein NL676_024601 [Syzygium grande]|nr:hypothetical protein NL676_024601 [Syzygium grande]
MDAGEKLWGCRSRTGQLKEMKFRPLSLRIRGDGQRFLIEPPWVQRLQGSSVFDEERELSAHDDPVIWASLSLARGIQFTWERV